MRKTIYFLFLFIGLGFYSCSSDDGYIDEVPNEAKMQAVSFDFPEFSETVMTRGTQNPSTAEKYSLNYYIFTKGGTKDGNFVKTKWVPKGGAISIKDTLPSGDYYVSIFASTANSLTDDCSFITLNYNTAATMHFNKFATDILYQTFELTVGNEAIQKPVTLERIVSKVEIVIEDIHNMPANILALSVSSENPVSQSAPSDFIFKNKQTVFTDHAAFLYPSRDEVLLSGSENPLSFYVFPSNRSDGLAKFGISISLLKEGFGNGGFIIDAVKVIKKDIKIDANRTIRLSGKLFENNIESNIDVNSIWGATIETGFDPL